MVVRHKRKNTRKRIKLFNKNTRRNLRKQGKYHKIRGGNKKNLALILYGRIASYEHSLDYLDSIFKHPNFNCKVFLSLNSTKSSPYIEDFRKRFEVTDEQFNVEPTIIPQSYIDLRNKGKPCAITEGLVNNPAPPKETMNPNDGCYSAYSVIYHQNRAFNLLKKYRDKHAINFDIVLVFRADMKSSSKEPFPINDVEENTIYVPEGTNDVKDYYPDGITTLAAYGNYNTMEKYCNVINNIVMGVEVERMLLSSLKSMNINIKRFPHELVLNPERRDPKYES